MRILILSSERDLHSQAVAFELRARGVDADIVDLGDWPVASALINNSASAGAMCLAGVSETDYRTVWLRRPRPSRRPLDIFHEVDRPALRADQAIFGDWFGQSFAPGATWVNPWGVHLSASNKMNQMRCAQDAGLCVPETLFSNDPQEIRAFLRSGPTVWKPIFRDPSLQEDGLVNGTRPIVEADLSADNYLRLQPCLLQRAVAKRAEYRVNVMGGVVTTVRFQPDAAFDASEIDWNFGRESDQFRAIPFQLDSAVEASILDLCRQLGVVFGCLDLVEDLDGNLFFLELNQMGQFLWLEYRLPELRLTGKFCDLLLE